MKARRRAPVAVSPATPRWIWAIPAVLAALITLPTLWNGFVLDDIVLLRDPRLGDLGRLLDLKSNELIVRYWSLQLDTVIWKGQAFGFHLTNLLMFVGVALALLGYLRALLERVPMPDRAHGPWKLNWRTWAAVAGTCVFVAHPMLTEAVAGVTHRKEILATGFLILALWRSLTGRSALRSVEVAFYVGMALFAKAIAVVFFPLVLLQDLWVRERSLRDWLRHDLPFYSASVAVLIGYVIYRWTGISGATAEHPRHYIAFNPQTAGLSDSLRLLTGVKTLGLYWSLLLLPLTPTLERFVEPVSTYSDPLPWVLALIAVAAFAVALRVGRKHPILGLGLAWIVLSPLPTLNLLPLNFLFAERYLFLPAVALTLLAVAALQYSHGRAPARGVTSVLVILVLAGSIRTAMRYTEWKNEDTLLEATIRDNGDAPRVQFFHALRLREQGRIQDSQQVIAASLSRLPKAPEGWHLAGRNYSDLGQLPEAIEAFARANTLARRPPANWLNDQAVALLSSGRPDEAAPVLREAVEMEPDNPLYRDNLIQALLMRTETRLEGMNLLDEELRLHPERPEPWILAVETRYAEQDTLAALRQRENARRAISDPPTLEFLDARVLEAEGQAAAAVAAYARIAADRSAGASLQRRAATAGKRAARGVTREP